MWPNKSRIKHFKPRNEEAMVKEHDEHRIHLQIKRNVKQPGNWN